MKQDIIHNDQRSLAKLAAETHFLNRGIKITSLPNGNLHVKTSNPVFNLPMIFGPIICSPLYKYKKTDLKKLGNQYRTKYITARRNGSETIDIRLPEPIDTPQLNGNLNKHKPKYSIEVGFSDSSSISGCCPPGCEVVACACCLA